MELRRREFLKLTTLLSAGLFKVNINEADPYNVWKPINPDQLDKSETVCPLCPSFCKLEVWKKRELIFGLYKKDDTYGMCPRVSAYHNIIYGEERIKTPLLRIKERGTIAFKPIDYDKAIQILKERLAKGGFYTDALAMGEGERFFLSALSEKINFIPDFRLKALCGADKVYFDLENASLVLNFGGDLLGEGNFIERANYIAQNGKNIITFSPVLTKGTALGEKWIPVKLSELAAIVGKLREAFKGKFDSDIVIAEVTSKVKKTKNVCLTFSNSLLETKEGVDVLREILLLADELKIINKAGGVFFYNGPTEAKPFDFFTENFSNYFAYNIDTTLLYPVRETVERLKKLPFVVYMGHHHSDLSLYADLILPMPFFVERKEAYLKRTNNGYKLVKSEVAIAGGVESQELRKPENIEVIFQKMLNLKAPYGIKGIDEVARSVKSGLPTLESLINSLEKKASIKAVVPKLPKEENRNIAKDLEISLISQNVLDFNTQGSKWAEEMDCRNSVLINPKLAQTLKIKNGDKVVIKGGSGAIKAKVFIFEGVTERTIALMRYRKKVQVGSPYKLVRKTKDRETKLIWWKPEEIELENVFSYSSVNNLPLITCDKIEIEKV